MTAGLYNITIEQGATFILSITYQDTNGNPVNLTNYTARMQAKQSYGTTALINLTTSNGGITLGGVAGTISLFMSATDTSALDIPSGLIYDLEIESSSGTVYRIIQGELTISPEVTT